MRIFKKRNLLLTVISALVIFTPKQSVQAINKACTPSIEPAITITITNFQTRKPIEANIIVKEGKFQEKLEVIGATSSGQVIYGGLFERPGRYMITISKQGYKTTTLKNINISKDECHVKTRRLNINLQPVKTSQRH
jgi:hypothetical protein